MTRLRVHQGIAAGEVDHAAEAGDGIPGRIDGGHRDREGRAGRRGGRHGDLEFDCTGEQGQVIGGVIRDHQRVVGGAGEVGGTGPLKSPAIKPAVKGVEKRVEVPPG